MRKYFALLCFSMLFVNLNGQTKIAEVDYIHMSQTGVMQSGSEVTGYYALIKSKKKVKKQNVFQLLIFGKDLKNPTTTEILKSDDALPYDLSYNGTHICILFIDNSAKTIECDIWDTKGTKTGSYSPSTPIPSDEIKEYKGISSFELVPHKHGLLTALPGKGFLRYGLKEADDRRVAWEAFDNNGKAMWTGSTGITAEKLFEVVLYSYVHENLLFTIVSSMENARSKNKMYSTVMHNISTGKHVATFKNMVENNYATPHGIVFDKVKKDYLFYGMYSDAKMVDATHDNFRKGIYFQRVSADGKITWSKMLNWETELEKLLPEGSYKTNLTGGGLFIADLIEGNDGSYTMICEKFIYRMRIGVGVAVGTGGAGTGPTATVDLESQNIFTFSVNADFSAKSAMMLEKEKHDANQVYTFDYLSIPMYEVAIKIKNFALYDYCYTETGGGAPYCVYQDIDKMKSKSTKFSIKQAALGTGKFSAQEILSESYAYSMQRCVPGSVFLIEYNRKEDFVNFSLLKLK